jgi:hypothetical protein
MDACPPLEDIAAFLDDTLSPEERERIAEHLDRCESCYEVFAGAAHFELELEEGSSAKDTGGRGVLPFVPLDGREGQVETEPAPAKSVVPTPARRRSPRWLPLAASVVLAAGLGFFAWQSFLAPPKLTAAGLVEPLEKRSGALNNLYQPAEVMRGDKEPVALISRAPSFLAGVFLVDLRLSAQAGEVKKTQDTLYSLSGELAQDFTTQDLEADVRKEADRMKDADALGRFVAKLPQLEGQIHERFSPEPFFSFGLWTEAGRLSAVTKSPDFFKSRDNRRFISSVRRDLSAEQDDRYDPILENLRQIEERWAKRDSSLPHNFQAIINQIEQIQREDAEDLTADDLGEPLPQ